MSQYSNFTILILPIAISVSGICMLYKTYSEMHKRVNDVFVDPLVAKKTYDNYYYALVKKEQLPECCKQCTFKCKKLFIKEFSDFNYNEYCVIKLIHNHDIYSDMSKDYPTIYQENPNFIVYNNNFIVYN